MPTVIRAGRSTSLLVDSTGFHRRAADCRELAANVRDVRDRLFRMELAEDLDAEPDKMDVDAVPRP